MMQPPQEQPQPAPQGAAPGGPSAGDPGQGGQALQEFVVGLNNNLMKFQEVIGSSAEIAEPLKAKLAGVVEGFQGFIQELVQTGGKGSAPAPQTPAGPVPVGQNAGTVPVQ